MNARIMNTANRSELERALGRAQRTLRRIRRVDPYLFKDLLVLMDKMAKNIAKPVGHR